MPERGQLPRLPPTPDWLQKPIIKAISGLHSIVYSSTQGRVGAKSGRADFLLLTTKGRKTGRSHTHPLLFIEDAGEYVVVASNGGQDHHPGWYLNVMAGGPGSVQIRGDRHTVTARTASDTDRERLWPRLVAVYKGYDDYAAKTSRRIPVVILTVL